MGSKWRISSRPSRLRDSSQTKKRSTNSAYSFMRCICILESAMALLSISKKKGSFIHPKILGFVPLRIIFYTVMCCVSILEGARILLLKKRPEICFMGVPHSILHLIFKNNFLYRHVLRKHPWRSPNFIVKEEDRVSIHAIQLCSVSFRNNLSIPSCVA